VSKSSLEGTEWIDDCEAVTQMRCSEAVEDSESNAEGSFTPDILTCLLSGTVRGFAGVVQRPTTEEAPRACLVVPSFVENVEDLDRYQGYQVRGKGIHLKGEVVIPPQVLTPKLGKRWLEEFSPPPRNKSVQRRFRLTVLDAVLACLRMLRDAFLSDVVSFGEGSLVCMCMLSYDIRHAAYQERHVSETERLELESVVSVLVHVILVCPLACPLRSYMPLLREYVPEIVCIIPPEQSQVLVVVPTKDAAQSVGEECAKWILGSLVEHITFPGPAYRTDPKSPLTLYQLHKPSGPPALVAEGPNKPPTLAIEAWAGCAEVCPRP